MIKPTPIREGIEPAVDQNRELLDYFVIRLQKHKEAFGEDADTVAIVTSSASGRVAHSFSLRNDSDKLGTCAAAAACLLERATRD